MTTSDELHLAAVADIRAAFPNFADKTIERIGDVLKSRLETQSGEQASAPANDEAPEKPSYEALEKAVLALSQTVVEMTPENERRQAERLKAGFKLSSALTNFICGASDGWNPKKWRKETKRNFKALEEAYQEASRIGLLDPSKGPRSEI